jgi:hypothetical protein
MFVGAGIVSSSLSSPRVQHATIAGGQKSSFHLWSGIQNRS